MTMAIMYSWVFLLICPVQFLAHGSGAQPLVSREDEFILVACGQKILSGNGDGTTFANFQELYTHTGSDNILDVDFDPVSDKILFNEGGNIHSVDPDGSNYQLLLEVNGARYIDLVVKHGYLYFLQHRTVTEMDLKRVDSNNVTTENIRTIARGLANVDFLTYFVDKGTTSESGIIYKSTNSQMYVTDLEANTCMTNMGFDPQVENFALNYDDELLYTIGNRFKETTMIEYSIDTDVGLIDPMKSDLPSSGGKWYRQEGLKYYDGYLYVPFGSQDGVNYAITPSKLGRYRLSDHTWEYLGIMGAEYCTNLHIHNPLDDVVTLKPESHRKSAVVETRRKWLGGFIADVSFEIGSSDELSRIELTFPGPRQVYTLGIAGCDLRQQRKKKIMKDGQRKGTTYTLVPTSDSTIEAGEDGKIRFTVIGKTWRKTRGFKTPITAEVHYLRPERNAFRYGSAEDADRCGMAV